MLQLLPKLNKNLIISLKNEYNCCKNMYAMQLFLHFIYIYNFKNYDKFMI